MTTLSSLTLLCIVFSAALASYEHISSWDCSYESCVGCRYITFKCGVNNKDYEAINERWPIEYYGTISFFNCRLSEIHTNFIARLYNIHTINIPNSTLKKLPQEMLRNATELNNLIAYNNRLTEIPPTFFANTTQLVSVDFSYNAIERIYPMVFENVHRLQMLNLSNNRLNLIEPNCLAHPKLQELDLSHNNLTSLENNVFDKMTELKHLNLSFNPIGNLHVGIFSQLAKLEYLSLKQTNIASIELGTLSYQHKLVTLDLSDNQLTELDFKLFFPIVHDMQALYLGQNQLRHLNGFQNKVFPKLSLLDIKNNLFNCSYLEYFFGQVDWEELRLVVDPSSTQLDKPNIRGINCEPATETHINEYLPVHANEMQNQLNGNLFQLIKSNRDSNERLSDDIFFMKVTQLSIFIVISICGAMYMLMNRPRLFCSTRYHHEAGEQNASSIPIMKYSVANDLLLE